MKFGGATHFGSGALGGDPYGHDPGYVCDQLVVALSRFLEDGSGAGCVKTVVRLAGDPGDPEQVARHLAAGVPAFLVWYQGGRFNNENVARTIFRFTATYSVICIAGDYTSQRERQQGRNRYFPSTDNLLNWATYYGLRALGEVNHFKSVRPVAHSYMRWATVGYVARVDFECQINVNIYDDDDPLSGVLEQLGIVHNPLDLGQLFQPDNETPNSNDPVGGGVFTLGE